MLVSSGEQRILEARDNFVLSEALPFKLSLSCIRNKNWTFSRPLGLGSLLHGFKRDPAALGNTPAADQVLGRTVLWFSVP